MPNPNAVVPEPIARLRGDAAASRAAWPEVRARLHRDPESWAEPLGAFLLESLDDDVPIRGSILPALEVCTRDRPELLSAELLDALLSRAAQLDTLSVLCLALIRVRASAEGLVSDGIQELLAATEHALVADGDDGRRDVEEYARDIAVELWETVAKRDPTALLVVLEFWTAARGWDRPTTRLLLDLLVRVSAHRPEVRDTLADELESARASLDPGDEAAVVDRSVDELRELRERAERRARAASIAEELAPAGNGGVGEGAPDEAAHGALDPDVARWKDDYLSDDPDRSFAAREPLAPGADPPSPALVAGAVEAGDELLRGDPWDDRVGPLVNFLCRTAESHPDLVPASLLERWTRVDALEEWERAMVYATLAQLEPQAIVEHSLDGALGAAAAAGGAFGSAILAGIGRADPELLVGFARRWLDQEGWTAEFGPALACAFEQVARERPDRRPAMIELLRARIVPESRDGDGFAEISRCIERIGRMETAGRA